MSTRSVLPTLLMAAFAMLTIAVYWPALHGGYLFDDSIYVVHNMDVHVASLHASEWVNAALSQAGNNQFRAFSMLSFAANYYFTGLDPFWFKLTNVGIHLLNGLLLFLVLRELLRLWLLVKGGDSLQRSGRSGLDLTAAVVSGAWLLLPINLTGVAYVSQRMESLANVFVFLGLFWYLHARRRQYIGQGGGAMLWISLIASTILGLGAKESAVLLPLYAACVEFAVTRFRNQDGRFSRPVLGINFVVLILPLIAGLVWISGWDFRVVANVRTFTIGERLLTEPRVLVDYIYWTLLPNLNSLTFYHDDLRTSHGLMDPPSTLIAIAALIALLGTAFWQRKARPLFCLGILWFFAGHALTGTIIPLELVFEHRNYFPSIGLLLAATSLLAIEPGLRQPSAKVILAAGFIFFFSFTTFLRAQEWSHPLRLALSEASKRPESMRAQYELARTLIEAAGSNDKSPLIDESVKILERTAFRADSGIAPLQALIYLNGRAHRNIDPAWWNAIVQKLRDHPPAQTEIDALIFLSRCQLRGDCPTQKKELLDAFLAALTTSGGNVNLMSAYADFAYDELDDNALAERMFREVVQNKPTVPVYHANLINLLLATGQFDAAESALIPLKALNRAGSLDTMITDLQAKIQVAKNAAQRAPANESKMSADPINR
jgi:protein O-mannosyl-transferase